jgi:hypothetical protein
MAAPTARSLNPGVAVRPRSSSPCEIPQALQPAGGDTYPAVRAPFHPTPGHRGSPVTPLGLRHRGYRDGAPNGGAGGGSRRDRAPAARLLALTQDRWDDAGYAFCWEIVGWAIVLIGGELSPRPSVSRPARRCGHTVDDASRAMDDAQVWEVRPRPYGQVAGPERVEIPAVTPGIRLHAGRHGRLMAVGWFAQRRSTIPTEGRLKRRTWGACARSSPTPVDT